MNDLSGDKFAKQIYCVIYIMNFRIVDGRWQHLHDMHATAVARQTSRTNLREKTVSHLLPSSCCCHP